MRCGTSEISAIAAEGKLGPILGESGYVSQQLESIEALLNAKQRPDAGGAAALFAILFAVVSGQSLRILRERDRTRKAERLWQDTEHKLRLMANNMKDMVLAYDMRPAPPLFANPAVETLTGYRIQELGRGQDSATGFIRTTRRGCSAIGMPCFRVAGSRMKSTA